MGGDRSADIWSGALNTVEHAVRQTGFYASFGEQERRHGRELARFSNRGVPDRNRWRDFPAQQIERQIPRRNQSGDAARLTQRLLERDAVGDVRFVFGVENRGREETKVRDGAWNIERARERNRLAGVDRFRAREVFQIALNQIGDAKKNLRSLAGRFLRPIRKSFLRSRDGKIDILFSAVGDLRVRLAGRGLDVVEIFAAERLDELAVDEVFDSWELILHVPAE